MQVHIRAVRGNKLIVDHNQSTSGDWTYMQLELKHKVFFFIFVAFIRLNKMPKTPFFLP